MKKVVKNYHKVRMTSKQELNEYYWPNGQLMSRGTYVDGRKHGRKHGEWMNWYDDGQLSAPRPFVNGQLHGECTEWHEGGELQDKETYVNGKKHGECKWWHENGQLMLQETYVNGKKKLRP